MDGFGYIAAESVVTPVAANRAWLRAGWTQIGDHQRAASMVADLERHG